MSQECSATGTLGDGVPTFFQGRDALIMFLILQCSSVCSMPSPLFRIMCVGRSYFVSCWIFGKLWPDKSTTTAAGNTICMSKDITSNEQTELIRVLKTHSMLRNLKHWQQRSYTSLTMFTSGNETKFIFRTLENSTKNRRRSTVINKTVLQVIIQ